MTDVTPTFKTNQGECGCGCLLFGTLKRPWRNGQQCVRGCVCHHCLGKRNRAKGDSKARTARKALGIAGANTRHEELWGGALRVEMKSGGQVRPVFTAFRNAEAQSELARPFGDSRPFCLVALPDKTSDGLVVFRLSQAAAVLEALAENLGSAS